MSTPLQKIYIQLDQEAHTEPLLYTVFNKVLRIHRFEYSIAKSTLLLY